MNVSEMQKVPVLWKGKAMESMTELAHRFVLPALHKQAVCLDGTLGHGHDAAFFLAHQARQVFAYEIQPQLAARTQARLDDPRLHVFLHSHARLEEDLQETSLDAALFNFGYDPKNPSGIHTRTDSSLAAVLAAFALLRPKGRMALVFYSHEEGLLEQEAIVHSLAGRQDMECLQVVHPFKPNAPVLLCIEKTSKSRSGC